MSLKERLLQKELGNDWKEQFREQVKNGYHPLFPSPHTEENIKYFSKLLEEVYIEEGYTKKYRKRGKKMFKWIKE
jgi:hypothetical protein